MSREEYTVTVLSRRPITVYPKLNQPVNQIMVSYVAAGLAPATVTINREDYTREVEKKLIKEDIQRRLKERPETFKV